AVVHHERPLAATAFHRHHLGAAGDHEILGSRHDRIGRHVDAVDSVTCELVPQMMSSTSAVLMPVRSASARNTVAPSCCGWIPDRAPLPALPMPRGVLHASIISASTMVLPSHELVGRICCRSNSKVNSPAHAGASRLASRFPVVATPIRSRGAILDDQFRLCAATQNNNMSPGRRYGRGSASACRFRLLDCIDNSGSGC